MHRFPAILLCLPVLGCVNGDVHLGEDDGSSSDAAASPSDAGALPATDASDEEGHRLLSPGTRSCAEVPIDVVRPACATDGWCWSHPLPQGNVLTATVGFTDADGHTTELWSVGHVGMALRLRGGVWEQVPTGTSVDLHGLWGTAPDDLWAVGDEGTILHYDGAAWSRVESGDTVPLTALWGSGRRDVWAAGYHGHVLHWDGQTWSRSLNPFPNHLYGIWGVAGDTRVNETRTLYAVGAEGTQLKWNGERWSAVPPLHTQSSFAVFGTSPDNVWTAAAGGIATHYDGTAWRASPTRTPFDLLAIGGTGPSDMWIAGGSSRIAHFDGDRWWTDQVGLREVTYRATWACGQNRAWFVGDQGKVVEWTADKGYTIRTKAFSDGYVHGGDIVEVRSISGSGPDDMWAASSDGLLHWEGSAWSRVATLGSPYQVWASRKNDAYATTYVGNTGKWHLLHWDGSVWTDAFANPDGLDFEAATGWDMAIGGTGPNDVWFTVPTLWTAGYGAPSLLHFDGTSWSVAAELAGYRIWAPGPGEAWIVGADRFYRHRPDGTASFRMPVGTQFRDIWGPSSVPATDIWAVGDHGAMARWDGSTWTMQPAVTDRALVAIWGSSPTDIWAAGVGVLLHYDGTAWSASYSVTTNRLGGSYAGGLWGNGSGDVWVIGQGGTIMRRRAP